MGCPATDPADQAAIAGFRVGWSAIERPQETGGDRGPGEAFGARLRGRAHPRSGRGVCESPHLGEQLHVVIGVNDHAAVADRIARPAVAGSDARKSGGGSLDVGDPGRVVPRTRHQEAGRGGKQPSELPALLLHIESQHTVSNDSWHIEWWVRAHHIQMRLGPRLAKASKRLHDGRSVLVLPAHTDEKKPWPAPVALGHRARCGCARRRPRGPFRVRCRSPRSPTQRPRASPGSRRRPSRKPLSAAPLSRRTRAATTCPSRRTDDGASARPSCPRRSPPGPRCSSRSSSRSGQSHRAGRPGGSRGARPRTSPRPCRSTRAPPGGRGGRRRSGRAQDGGMPPWPGGTWRHGPLGMAPC